MQDDAVLVTVREAAEMLGLSIGSMYELVASGTFTKRYVGQGNRNYRLEASEVREWALSLPTEPRST